MFRKFKALKKGGAFPVSKYETKQRKRLTDLFASHADEMLSAEQLYALLDDKSVSMSAIYRNLAELESEGKLTRLSRPGSRSILYRYTENENCREKIHLSCKLCGKTFHLRPSETEKLVSEVEKNDGFLIDRANTVLFGVCGYCMENERRTGVAK